ncbi:ANTAR domain-containing protein [Actinomycetospora sp. CA-101289]|uniref:ANTAR domain-containing protein n=1 Tax=Actinomycetospora sp. CA-101289 TaxID=3239893 RepID=UPI003D99D8B8
MAREFSAVARMLSAPVGETGGVVDVLDRVAHAALKMIDGAEMVSVSLRLDDGAFTTPARTDVVAGQLDQAQYEAGEGPCLAATITSGLGLAYHPDLAVPDHPVDAEAAPGEGDGVPWPTWGPRAVALGVRCVLSTGIFPDGEPPRQAALNCYSSLPHALDHADRDTALLLASFAGVALHHTAARTAAELEAAHLRAALSSRDVIGQAKGILMERHGYDADRAFDALTRASQQLNVKLRDIADTLARRHREL